MEIKQWIGFKICSFKEIVMERLCGRLVATNYGITNNGWKISKGLAPHGLDH